MRVQFFKTGGWSGFFDNDVLMDLFLQGHVMNGMPENEVLSIGALLCWVLNLELTHVMPKPVGEKARKFEEAIAVRKWIANLEREERNAKG
jgi:hypothetical protein